MWIKGDKALQDSIKFFDWHPNIFCLFTWSSITGCLLCITGSITDDRIEAHSDTPAFRLKTLCRPYTFVNMVVLEESRPQTFL